MASAGQLIFQGFREIPKQVNNNQDSTEKSQKFLISSLNVFLLHSRTELGLEGKDVTDFCQNSAASPAGSKGRRHHELSLHYCNTQIHGLLLITQPHCSSSFTQCRDWSSHLPGPELDLISCTRPLWQVLGPPSTEGNWKRKRSKNSFKEAQKNTLERMGGRQLVSELQADDSHVFPVD